ncbi:MAG: class I SAM-dependent methyltransferase [Halioglobus sp.]
MQNHLLTTPLGIFQLQRYPPRPSDSLQAWNSADTLLIDAIHKEVPAGADVLVVNDDQGALSLALSPVSIWSDSALSGIAISRNLQANDRGTGQFIASTEYPAGPFSAVALKVPKLLSYFEYQLALLAAVLQPGTPLFASGMDKHLSPQVASLLEKYIGPTQRQRGQHKARVFVATKDQRENQPGPGEHTYFCEALGRDLTAKPNVFSRDSLDIGSRFLIEHFSQLGSAEALIDLACGNGVLGLCAERLGLAGTIAFCDESAMAIASARANAGQGNNQYYFQQADGLIDYAGPEAQLILCNPPFHSNHAVDEYAGKRLIQQCADYLTSDGRLCLVANRHLPYAQVLGRGFRQVEKLAQSRKFTIWLAVK